MLLARTAESAGTRVIVATPHVSPHYQNEADTIERLTDELNTRLRQEKIAVEILAGAEIAMTRASEIAPEDVKRLSLGDGPWVLLEPPFTPIAPELVGVVATLQSAGHKVLLAHPERCPALHREPRVLESLIRTGTLTSITAGSLVGRFGRDVRHFARHLFAEGLVHNVASDAHDAVRRPPGVRHELAEAGFEALAGWLTHDVPHAILSGGEIPPRPVASATAASRFPRMRRRRSLRRAS